MWNELPEKDRTEYKNYILAFASLTEAFAQKAEGDETLSPIINSKYQETVFQKAFNATVEDIGNSSYDASILIEKDGAPDEKYIVGIKTFGISSDSSQKIAQFKKKQQESWLKKIEKLRENAKGLTTKEEIDNANYDLYLDLAICISEIRNARIRSSVQQLKGFEYRFNCDTDFTVAPDHVGEDEHMHSVYHTLQPSPKGEEPKIYVREDAYNTIDIDNITICGCTSPKNPANFEFDDGQHKYKYTPADSQLYMDFQNAETMDVWNVIYVDDAYRIFKDLGHNIYADKEESKTVVEEYIWPIVVQPYSGFNSFFGTGSKVGIEGNRKRLTSLGAKYADLLVQFNDIYVLVERYLLSTDIDRQEKVILRNRIVECLKTVDNKEFSESVGKLLFRPVNEIYIPVPKSSKFHTMHPDFFGKNIGNEILGKNNDYCKEHPFSLRFEPSGNTISAFITQDSGKAIQSINKQSILGEWILKGVFQLKDYEQLTQERLDELEINALRLYKLSGSDEVHIEFVWVDDPGSIDPTENRAV